MQIQENDEIRQLQCRQTYDNNYSQQFSVYILQNNSTTDFDIF